jgi:hypothetical protein|tara:strand:+ start:3936 stop:4397 length:462 start_codon:yes stop_codon:yes gene_type:complete
MAQQKLPLKDILAAIDMGAKTVWDEFTDDERKQISFWLLNRYVSSVAGNREKQELAVFKTNEYYNKNYMEISKHQKLQWQLLCLSGNTGKIEFHKWQGLKQKKSSNSKIVTFLEKQFPNMKEDEIELLATISTKKELQEYAETLGMDKKDVNI